MVVPGINYDEEKLRILEVLIFILCHSLDCTSRRERSRSFYLPDPPLIVWEREIGGSVDR